MAATARLAARTFTATSPASRESAIREFLRATGRLTATSGATPGAAAQTGTDSPQQPASSGTGVAGQAAPATAAAPQVDAAAGNSPAGNSRAADDSAPGRNQAVQQGPRGAAPAVSGRTFSAIHTAPEGGIASSGSGDPAAADSTSSERTGQSGSASDRPIAAASIGAAPADMSSLVAQVSAANSAVGAARPLQTAAAVGGVQSARDLTDSADRLMDQVVKTIHSFQTAGGPALEARISDPILGDVKLTVTGQAGEIVQAQLVVGNRTSADALVTAAARSHASGEALAGVNVSVRTESGGSWNSNGRSGGTAADSMTWGQGASSHAGSGDAGGRGGDPGTLSTAGNGTSGHGPGTGPSAGGTHGSERSSTTSTRPAAPETLLRQPTSRLPRSGGSSLDVRA